MPDYRTSHARVKGLGSAQSGTGHFWEQRVTGAANLVLLVFVIFSALCLVGQPYAVVRGYFASPVVAVLSAAFALSTAWHMRLGMQIVIEDYIHRKTTKVILLLLNTFFTAVVALASLVAIFKLSLGA
jgi:succinate dehydrogenase / fumarate reductase membrane anchor subunit